jgi:hypothetical protein
MPVPKKRKRTGPSKKRIPFKPKPPSNPERWSVTLNGAYFRFLKDEPDFQTMVKIGRAVNALGYAMQTVHDSMGDTSNIGRRQYHRGIFVLAGYLHQSIKIVHGIKERYLLMAAFQPLRAILYDGKYKKTRDYSRKIRNFTAFHLDEYGDEDRTAKMLSLLKPSSYRLMGGDDPTFGTFYFDFADFLDFGFIVEEFFPGSESPDAINDIVKTIISGSIEFLEAAHDFQIALSNRMELKEYIYR